MKKLLSLFSLVIAVGALSVSNAINKKVEETKAIDYESYIRTDSSFFTNWTDAAGGFGDRNSTFWGENYHFQAVDTFYRGELAESWTGTLTSRTWKQHTQYIYFQLGGAKNFDVTGDPVHLNIYYGGYMQSVYNDTFVENPMLLRYFKIPDTAYEALMENGDDFDMHIEIVDYQVEGYGFANFGYLNVNQTAEQVSDAMRWFINNLNLDDREWEVNKRKQILENYYLNSALREMFLRPVSDISDDFESNNGFINHWYFDYQYYNGANWGLHFDKAIGFDFARPDLETMMPFNKTGNGFFRGWFENDELGGFVGGDSPRYRFISRPFVLSGTGLVSIKMAGTASLHVIDTETRQDLVWADLLTFNTNGDQVNLANSDFNTVTMVRHFINLEAYVGRNIQLAIADISDSSWSALYVDELVTNYENYPSFNVDIFTQSNNSGTFYGYKTDKYINSAVFNGDTNPNGLKYVLEAPINQANDNEIINHVDNSLIKDAYNFLQNYYSSLRSPNNEFNYDRASDEVKSSLIDAYNALSNETKAIINNSADIEYDFTFASDWWTHPVTTSNDIIIAFNSLLNPVAVMYTVSFDANGGSGDMGSYSKEEGTIYALPGNGFTAPEGYRFIGWYVGEDTTLRQPGYEFTVVGDVVIHAQWEEIPIIYYTISFDANGGSGSMESLSKQEGSVYALPGNGFIEPNGYRFIAWTIGNDTELRQPGYEITVNEDVVIKAQWELVPVQIYTISFNANGGYGTMASLDKEEGTSYLLPKATFKAPYSKQFAGWKVNGVDDLLEVGAELIITSNIELVAQWKDAPVVMCEITFNPNGGTGEMETIQVERGSTFVLPECTFTAPEGKEFHAWLISSVKYQPGQKITISGDTRFDAGWVNVAKEESKQEESGEEPKSVTEQTIIDKVLGTIQNIFNKIVDFFKNLFAKLQK